MGIEEFLEFALAVLTMVALWPHLHEGFNCDEYVWIDLDLFEERSFCHVIWLF